MKKRTTSYLVETALDIENYTAHEKGTIGYAPKIMTSMSLPMRKTSSNEFVRKNGHYKISITSPSEIGLPYGSYLRQFLILLTTQSKITKSNEIYCGKSFSELAGILGKHRSGGEKGSITSLKNQFKRLFASTIHWIKDIDGEWSIDTMNISRSASMLWNPFDGNEWESFVTLGEMFYEDIQLYATPIDMRVIDAFSHYPLAIDIYCFLTSRYFRLRKPALISWRDLVNQCGCSYKKMSNFRQSYIRATMQVKTLYPQANLEFTDKGLWLFQSKTHIPSKQKISCG
jgi:Plasmid encoded RepA protein